MANPWDRPPFPKKGNASQAVLFAAMGRALNAWEEIEMALAHLHAVFVTEDRFDSKASHAYGVPANFNRRFALLQKAAEKYFMPRAEQALEGEFIRLSELIVGYSARRNDIAHGHALHIHWALDPNSRETLFSVPQLQWCLVPPFFRENKFEPPRDRRRPFVLSYAAAFLSSSVA